MKKALITLGFLASTVLAVAEENPMTIKDQAVITSSKDHEAIAAAAKKKIGLRAHQLNLPGKSWCADFTNLVRREAGFKTSPSRRAVDQVKNARVIREPVVGSIMIRRNRPHVDVVVAVLSKTLVLTIGGNVSDEVTQRVQVSTGYFVLPESTKNFSK